MLSFKTVKLKCQLHPYILLLQICATYQRDCGFGSFSPNVVFRRKTLGSAVIIYVTQELHPRVRMKVGEKLLTVNRAEGGLFC